MPSLSFVLPHWLYWATLVLFPFLAMYFVARQQRHPPDRRPSLFIGYLFLLLAGFLGIHRFYARSAWGFIFIPVFLGIIYCNVQTYDLRDNESRTYAALERAQSAADVARPKAEAATPEESAAYAKAKATVSAREAEYQVAKGARDRWKLATSATAGVLALMLLVDAALLPGLVRRRRELELAQPDAEAVHAEPPALVHEGGVGEDPTLSVHTGFSDLIERIDTAVGRYVSYWALIAVFAYYYEVMARYVFNSPTNWVHESMFLMFGMQYMLCGAFAYKEDQHVRVDVFYAKFSTRGKAAADIFTSIFFFVFSITMFWTSSRFALDAIKVGEHSFTEWGIQYWPVKLTMPIGSGLLVLQGVAKLVKDIVLLTRKAA
jgi:TRAP-type mannitol/chloroaromatic compound transport system permease small subunit